MRLFQNKKQSHETLEANSLVDVDTLVSGYKNFLQILKEENVKGDTSYQRNSGDMNLKMQNFGEYDQIFTDIPIKLGSGLLEKTGPIVSSKYALHGVGIKLGSPSNINMEYFKIKAEVRGAGEEVDIFAANYRKRYTDYVANATEIFTRDPRAFLDMYAKAEMSGRVGVSKRTSRTEGEIERIIKRLRETGHEGEDKELREDVSEENLVYTSSRQGNLQFDSFPEHDGFPSTVSVKILNPKKPLSYEALSKLVGNIERNGDAGDIRTVGISFGGGSANEELELRYIDYSKMVDKKSTLHLKTQLTLRGKDVRQLVSTLYQIRAAI